jgi:hypothetical protein
MKIDDINELLNDLRVVEDDCEKINIAIAAKGGKKASELLQKIKAMGYAAFLHAGAFGIEVIVTDRLSKQE